MRFILRDAISLASGSCNEDRLGLHGAAAWVIDGATDLLEERLLPGPSDAAWLADTLGGAFMRLAEDAGTLEALLAAATEEVRAKFEAASRRPIAHRYEQPSAAGIFARLADGHLEALSLGDCTLLALSGEDAPHDLFRAVGQREADEHIRATVTAMAERLELDARGIRAGLMPTLRASRSQMNTAEGFGVFSIDLPPARHVSIGRRKVGAGDLFLFASDGFLRLVDVYGALSLTALGQAIRTEGIAALALMLRKIEAGDPDCRSFPRAKPRDDATAMIVQVVG